MTDRRNLALDTLQQNIYNGILRDIVDHFEWRHLVNKYVIEDIDSPSNPCNYFSKHAIVMSNTEIGLTQAIFAVILYQVSMATTNQRI